MPRVKRKVIVLDNDVTVVVGQREFKSTDKRIDVSNLDANTVDALLRATGGKITSEVVEQQQ